MRVKGSDIGLALAAGLAAATGLAFLVPPATALASGYLLATAGAIAVIDARRFIIPDRILVPAIPAGLVARLLSHPDYLYVLEDCLLGAVLGGGSFYLMRWLYRSLRGRHGLGLGDVKLAAVAGLWLGPAALPLWVLTACVAALIAIAAARLLRNTAPITATTAIPFGTFLAPSLWLVWTVGAVSGAGLFDLDGLFVKTLASVANLRAG